MEGKKTNQPTNQVSDEYTNGVKILFQTSMGEITLQLRNDMPITTNNFKILFSKENTTAQFSTESSLVSWSKAAIQQEPVTETHQYHA